MSVTIYLRFPSEAAFRSTLDPSFTQQGETGYPLPDGVEAIRIVGAMYESGVLVPGFHINVLNTLPDMWKPYQVFPVTPQGVFG